MSEQAAEAREQIREALDLGLQAWRTTPVREKFLDALKAVDALSVRLAQECTLRAQAEQERDACRDRKVAVEEMAVRLRVTDALLREYEEALHQLCGFVNAGYAEETTVVAYLPTLREIAKSAAAALAASAPPRLHE